MSQNSNHTAAMKITIVGGCGHIGLPLGIKLAEKGYQISLFDINEYKVNQVNLGQMPFTERGSDELLKEVVTKRRLTATLRYEAISEAEIVILTTGTPVDQFLNPKVRDVLKIIDQIKGNLKDHQTIILRSTLYPGTSEMIYRKIKELNLSISVSFCPERIAEGNAMSELSQLPQIVSGFDEKGLSVAKEIFGHLTNGKIIQLSPLEAELCKLFCNTWRYINFSISNEFYEIATRAGADFNKVHAAATQDYPRMTGFAKAGLAAGPCLFKDTMQLAAFSQNSFFLGHAAMLVNEGLPAFLVNQLRDLLGGSLIQKKVSVLGMTFKKDSDDPRESLSFKIYKQLEILGADVSCHDPFIEAKNWSQYQFLELDEVKESQDGVIIGTPHSVYQNIKFHNKVKIVDVWGVI